MQISAMVSFAHQHWILVVLLIILVMVIIAYETRSLKRQGVNQATPQQVVHLINREDAKVWDLRVKDVFKTSHIVNAQNMGFENAKDKLKNLKESDVVVLVASDQQAMKVTKMIREQGSANVKLLAGGMKAWSEAGLPLEKK